MQELIFWNGLGTSLILKKNLINSVLRVFQIIICYIDDIIISSKDETIYLIILEEELTWLGERNS